MPRISQLPEATSVSDTDVLAIDTPNKTYRVPRSVLAPPPFVVAIPAGQWSGSGSDRYITVQASNVTANSVLVPHYDNASAALLKGPVWCVPAAGSFTVHTSAIPAGTVTIMVQLVGTLGEAQYQVLADVYSKSQVDTIVAQSTADTGWITLNATYPTYYRKRAGVVYVLMRLIGGQTPTDGMLLGTLPNGYIPNLQVVASTQNLRGSIFVNSNGQVTISENSGYSLNNYMGCIVSFPV